MAERTLYHVTHRSNLASILRQGLRPTRAKTKWSTIWLCSEEAIADIIQHMAQRHRWTTTALIVFRVQIDTNHLRRNRAIGIYHYPHEIPVSREDVFLWERGELRELNDR